MGYFDEMKIMLGKGVNVADRKTQEIRLQAELSRIGSSLESAYSALGKVVYSHPTLAGQVQRECPGEYNGVSSLLKEAQSIREQIGELQRQAAVAAAPSFRQPARFFCANCGGSVSLDMAYCPFCGDNLSDLKSQYRKCPSCGTYYSTDVIFCVECGSKTVEVPVALAVRQNVEEEDPCDATQEMELPIPDESQAVTELSSEDEAQNAEPQEQPEVEDEPTVAQPTCPNCGAPVSTDDAFCVECGSRLK